MANITIDLGLRVGSSDVENLRRRLLKLTPEDEITIRLEAADAHQAGKIVEELERQGFDYQPHGGHGADYYLIARKKPVH